MEHPTDVSKMEDVFSIQRLEMHRPETVLPSSFDHMLQRLDKAYQRFWKRLEVRMSTPHAQYKGSERKGESRGEPGPPQSKAPSQAMVKPYPGTSWLRATLAKPVKHPTRRRRLDNRKQLRTTRSPCNLPIERDLEHHVSVLGFQMRTSSQTQGGAGDTLAHPIQAALPGVIPTLPSQGIG
ncbi:Hypothetical predicted protein [Pelobates cultripes]|uniref:Uncharacterized protein n=1 Tax=Pelobates cultripes TaxID=61616 RepID=A0AAD1R6U0_PELCU|nr:Hypothetical predicted protein [Pelobates cultripes]